MRTTLIIPDQVFKAARSLARTQNRTLSEFVAESLAVQIARCSAGRRTENKIFLKSISMGKPSVDVGDRNDLYEVSG